MEPAVWQYLPIDPVTKTYLAFGLVILALFEFYTAMRLFGSKGPPAGLALLMRLHRLFGYLFVIYFVWISWLCLEIMNRLARVGNYELDARASGHALLAFVILAVVLLKISFIRLYRNYRPYVPLLGITAAVGTVVLWCFAGLMFLYLVAGTEAITPPL